LLLSGDFVFVGDVGRPDLLDTAAGGTDTSFAGAGQLFDSLRDHFVTLPDEVQVWPGHGAGSACGRALGSAPSSTVGHEKQFAWWAPFVQDGDRQGFIMELLDGQPDAPHYFGRMKLQNREGPALLGQRQPLRQFSAQDMTADYQLIDTRSAAAFNEAGLQAALHIPGGRKFATYASYVLDPAQSRPLVLLAEGEGHASELRDRLAWVGFDDVAGYISDLEGFVQQAAPQLTPAELDALPDAHVIDVRSAAEHAAGSISGAQHLHAGSIVWRRDELAGDRPVVVYCQSGARATLAASALRLVGVDARELAGNYPAWQKHQESEGQA
jgi:hydroxyacylglutathione hydrolase